MKNVLLIAGLRERYYFEPFVNACKGKRVNLYICDPSRFPNEATLCVTQDRMGRISGFIEVVQLLNNMFAETRINLSEIDTAWHLRESRPLGGTSLDLETRFAANETRQAFRAIFSLLECRWVNSSDAIDRVNSNKLYQQAVAARCGLSIPTTIISNDPAGILEFASPTQGLLAKTMGYIRLDDAGLCSIYSERFSCEELAGSSDAIRACPIYGQTYIEKRYEHRVMVIGKHVLSCQINSQASEATKTDWRHYDFENVEHKQVDLPSATRTKLLRFMEGVDLRYGAIDLIETPDGEFVFLEVNPSGQWGWIADLGGLPIPEAVADMLETM